MARSYYYSGDPHWINARYAGKCRNCLGDVPQNSRAFYYPRDKAIYCEGCGKNASAEFEGAAADEYMTTRGMDY